MEYRIIKKWGLLFVELRYKGSDWSNWLFRASETPKTTNWIYIPELGLYRSNVSFC